MAFEISLCMIVKNEQKNLDNCLRTVYDLVDEINIIDTGSADNTVDIASRYTDRIFFFDWINDFSAARNFSFSKATKDYILWLDADDIITEDNRKKFLLLKKKLTDNINYVLMKYHYDHDERGNVTYTQLMARLVKRREEFKWSGAIHENIQTSGDYLISDIFITHTHKDLFTSFDRTFEILTQRVNSGNQSINDIYYYGLALFQNNQAEESLEQLKVIFKQDASIKSQCLDAYIAAHLIYCQKKDYENAYHILADNECLFKDKSEFYCCLGYFFRDVHEDLDKACQLFSQALTCKGYNCITDTFSHRYEEYYYYQPYYSIAQCMITLHKYEEAIEYLKIASSYANYEKTLSLIDKLESLVHLLKK